MTAQHFSIRFATKEDVPLLLTLIKALAEHEQLLHKVTATTAQLKQTLFGDKPEAEVILGCINNKPISFAIFFAHYSTYFASSILYLEDIFVVKEYRSRGIGKKMMAYLSHLALSRNYAAIKWWVLNHNEVGRQFYKMIGANALPDYTAYQLFHNDLTRLAKEWQRT